VWVPNAHALQVSYTLSEQGDVDIDTSGSNATALDVNVPGDQGDYRFFGSVVPDRVGLIGVSSGFQAAVNRVVPGVTPAQTSGGSTGGGGPGFDPVTTWDRITIDTIAAGTFQTLAEVNGLSSSNSTGFVQFDWVVTGVSSLFLDAGDGTLFGNVTVEEAASVARLGVTGDLSIPDAIVHSPTPGNNGLISDVMSADLQVNSFLVPYDFNQLNDRQNPLVNVDFELAVSTRLNITNDDNLGNFEALFDANFSNTATLTNVTVLDSNQNPILGASVVDAGTGQSIVASSVPEPSSLVMIVLIGCAGGVRRKRR